MKRLLMIITLTWLMSVNAETVFNIGNNTVSSGKVIIDGKDVSSEYGVSGSGKMTTISKKISPFSMIEVYGGIDLIFRQSSTTEVKIKGDDNLVGLVSAKVSRGRLRISMTESYSTSNPLVVRVSSPRLKSLKVNGSSRVSLEKLNIESLDLDLVGSGDILAEGKVIKLSILLDGAGDVNAGQLFAQQASVVLKGVGNVEVYSGRLLNVVLEGSGDVIYYGRPNKINKKIHGVGDVEAGD